MKRLLLVLLITATSMAAFGQIPHLDALRAGEKSQLENSWADEEAGRVKMLEALPGYYSDTLMVIRQQAVRLAIRAGQQSDRLSTRQRAVEQVTMVCFNQRARVVSVAVHGLKSFRSEDFSAQAKANLVKALQGDPKFYVPDFLKLIGFTEPENGQVVISDYLYEHPDANLRVKLSALLALARMGDKEALQEILQKAKRVPVGDDLIYEVLPEVLYTRQPEAINFAVEVMNSKEKACYPPNPDATSRIVCGYRVMEMLAPIVEGFPLKVGPSGDILTDDYEKALQTSRKWFDKQKGNYRICRDRI